MKYKWNKPYQMTMKIKRDYFKKFPDSKCMNFEKWIKDLNIEKYNNFIEPLQVNQKDNLILIRYGLAEMQRGMWEDKDSIYRQCRSVVIDIENEDIVASPFKKFFNLNEVEENQIDLVREEIKNAKVVEISDKLDGSMQSLRYYNNEYMMFGSMALDKEDSWRLSDGYNMLTDNHKRMARDNRDFTFVFENVSPKNAHVVVYNEEQAGLYLIGGIDVYTGYELMYHEIKDLATKYDVKCAEIENHTIDEILELSKQYKSNEKEGWVINIDGHKVKLKCDDYVKLHRILDKVSSVNVIIQSIADDSYDDLISKVPQSYRHRVEKISSIVFEYVSENKLYIQEKFDEAPKEDKKEFMIWVNNNVEKKMQGYIRSEYMGIEYNLLKSKNGSYKKIKDIVGSNVEYSALFGGE